MQPDQTSGLLHFIFFLVADLVHSRVMFNYDLVRDLVSHKSAIGLRPDLTQTLVSDKSGVVRVALVKIAAFT